MYKPKPIDTSAIELPNELHDLLEKLAENVHEVWAQQRMEQGWTFGENRNDELKTHPNLVPYNELTEKDKDYDRHTAMETLKLITLLGYSIEKK